MKPETRLDIAKRLVVEAEAMVVRQQKLVAELNGDGHGTGESLELLAQFENALTNFRRTLALFQSS